jgi:hypothetical protein
MIRINKISVSNNPSGQTVPNNAGKAILTELDIIAENVNFF